MATVGEAIAASISAQWNVGTGGTKPDPIKYVIEDSQRVPNTKVADAVFVWLPLRRDYDNDIDVAEKFRNVTYTVRIECHTKTDSARQLEIENEVDRILASGTPITGATKQRVLSIADISDRSYSVGAKFVSEILMTVFTAMEVSATAYGGATTAALVTDTLEFTAGGGTIDRFYDEDDMASDDEDGLASQQSIKAYTDLRLLISEIDNTPVNGVTVAPISSNWAFDHDANATAHHTATVAGDLNHNDLANIDAADIKHITAAQLAALHATYTDAQAVTAVEAKDPLTPLGAIKNAIDNKGFYTGAADDVRLYFDGTDVYLVGLTGASDIFIDARDDIYFRVDGQNAITNAMCLRNDKSAVFYGTLGTVGVATFDSGGDNITSTDIADLLMFGAANAAMVPCILELEDQVGKIVMSWHTVFQNVDGTDFTVIFRCPLPTVKGGLKLYVGDVRVGIQDADADDYLDNVIVGGIVYNTVTTLNSGPTNRTSPNTYTYPFTPADASGYDSVALRIQVVATNAGDFNLTSVELECYYAA